MIVEALLFITLLLVLCLPGAMTLCATTALFVRPRLPIDWSIGRVFLVAFMGWMVVATVCSPWWETSLYGSDQRVEGLLTWLVLARIAWLLWETGDVGYIGVAAIFSLAIIAILYTFSVQILTPVAFGALCAVVAGLFAVNLPWLSVLCVVGAACVGSRAGVLAALVGMGAAWVMAGNPSRRLKTLAAFALPLAVALAFTPVAQKTASLNLSTLGSGARSQMVAKCATLTYKRPLVGYGMDVGSEVLTRPGENVAQIGAVYDKVHFGPLDLVLQVGWIGLTFLLLSTGWVVGCAVKLKSSANMACFGAVIAWWAFGLLNPQGIPATMLFLACLVGAKARAER